MVKGEAAGPKGRLATRVCAPRVGGAADKALRANQTAQRVLAQRSANAASMTQPCASRRTSSRPAGAALANGAAIDRLTRHAPRLRGRAGSAGQRHARGRAHGLRSRMDECG
jgi:hypothetical protein